MKKPNETQNAKRKTQNANAALTRDAPPKMKNQKDTQTRRHA
jgi:hypothetical protein